MGPTDNGDEARRLVRGAFAAAKSRGKPDWATMTLGVLKNRLLQQTDRGFDEAAFGAATFVDFVRGMDDVVELDDTVHPAIVRIIEDLQPEAATGPRERIRPDLWNAIVDYRSGDRYVWDQASGRAVGVPANATDDRPRLPTLSPDELSQWRRAFLEHAQEGSTEARLWAERGLSAVALPKTLRGRWNSFQRARIVERLTQWFDAQGMPAPPDLARREAMDSRSAESTDLRTFVLRCIDLMTDAELAQLPLPARAAMRVRSN